MLPTHRQCHADLPSIRLLVLGDSNVGKTSLVSRISQDKLPGSLKWTQQANIEIMMHICGHKSYFVEFIDVSGLISSKMARRVYYQKVDGVVLIFDTNNNKSYANLRGWLQEYYSSASLLKNETPKSSTSFLPQVIIGGNSRHKKDDDDNISNANSKVPVFIIGNKIDLHSDYKATHMLPNEFNFVKDFGFDGAFFSSFLTLRYQREAMSQLKKYLNSIIIKLEQLQNRHFNASEALQNASQSASATVDEDDNESISSLSTNASSASATITSLKSKLFSFW